MTPHRRLSLWAVLTLLAVTASHAAIAMPTGVPRSVAGGVLTLALAGVVVLIDTTPADAIRLRPWRSVWLLALLTAALYAHAAVGRSGPDARQAAWVTLAAVGFMSLAVKRRITPWWALPLWWNSAMAGPVALATPWPTVLALAYVGLVAARRARRN